MALGIASGCINHPGVEAVGRCKRCGKPFCGTCRITGPTGNFCSEDCKVTHEQFTERAQKLDNMSRKSGLGRRLWYLGRKVLVFAVVILVLTVVLSFLGIRVPVVSDLIGNLLNR